MAASSTASGVTYDRQAGQLREQLQSLLPDQVGAVASATADNANASMRQLLDYAILAFEFRKPISNLVRRVSGRAPHVPADPVRNDPKPSRRGLGGRLRRHPWLAVGLTMGAGLIAYRVLQALPHLRQRKGSFFGKLFSP